MFWIFVLAVLLAVVFFKLGVYSVVFGAVQLGAKVLFVASGAFLVYGVWRWLARRRASLEPVRYGARLLDSGQGR